MLIRQFDLKKDHRFVFFALISLLFVWSSGGSFAAEEVDDGPVRVRIFTLRQITVDDAKRYLSEAGVGDTVFAIPGTSSLSVTGSSAELVFAKSIFELVDSSTVYSVRNVQLLPGQEVPGQEALSAEFGREFVVGSLLSGPRSANGNKVIVDSFSGREVVIAPAEHLIAVVSRVEQLRQKLTAEKASADVESKGLAVSVNDVNIAPGAVAGANDILFIEEPEVIESAVGVAGDDEMIGELLEELSTDAVSDIEFAEEPEVVESDEVRGVMIDEAGLDEKIAAAVEGLLVKMRAQEEALEAMRAEKLAQQEFVSAQAVEDEVEEPSQLETAVDIPNREQVLDLSLPEKLEIVNLIDLVGKYMNLNYLYDEAKVKGFVTLKVQGKITIGELYELLESALKFRGLAMSRKGDLVTIVPAAEALDQDPVFTDGPIQAGDVVVTSVFKLDHISTEAAKAMLTSMKLGSNITTVKETGSLVITEYAYRMKRIEELLNIVDVKGPPKEFKLRVLNYTLAESLVPKIKALAEQLGTVDVTVGAAKVTPTPSRVTTSRRTLPTRTTTATPAAATTAKTGVFIDFDERTNRVLMIGLADEVAAVERIIDSLDVPQQDLRRIREYELQYIDIETVVGALEDFGILEGGTDRSAAASGATATRATTSRPGASDSTAAAASAASIEAGGPITIDQPQVVQLETANSILVNATPEQHVQIAKIISYIDREPLEEAIPFRIYRLENQKPEDLATVLNELIEKTITDEKGKVQKQVTREEDIAVVPDENTFSVIVYASKRNQEWIANLIETLDKRRPQVLIDVSLVEVQKNDDFEYDLSIVANAKTLATSNTVIQGGQFVADALGTMIEGGYNLTDSDGVNTKNVQGFYNAGKIQALLKLIDTKGYGRVLAQPKVLVNDNEEGLIQTSQKTHVREDTTSYPGDGTNSVTTTIWNPYEAKIELKITPQISEGDLLRLEIEMVREDFVETSEGPPDYTTSNVNTIVTVPDGSTIILGGLTKLNQTKSGSKVPGLGDVPVVGSLFRSVDNAVDERRLYVFVKANILRPDMEEGLNQLTEISGKNRATFEKYEDEFQAHESFPGVEPEIVEPVHVLDDIVGGEEELDSLQILGEVN